MTTIDIKYGDSVQMMIGMMDETIHLAVTSPPYDKLREYNGNGIWDFENTAGSGTVGWMARDMNRNSVMIDKDHHAIGMMRRKRKLLQPELV